MPYVSLPPAPAALCCLVFDDGPSSAAPSSSQAGLNLLDLGKAVAERLVRLRSTMANANATAAFQAAQAQGAVFVRQPCEWMLLSTSAPDAATAKSSVWDPAGSAALDAALRGLAPTARAPGPGGQNRALSAAFAAMGRRRLASGVDNYGGGRRPWHLQPSAAVCVERT